MKNCPLCGHDAYVSLFDGKFKVVLCRTCSLVFIPNDSRDLKKFYSEEYSYQETKSDFIDDTKFNNRIFNWIIKSIDASKEIDLLEVGSHSGFLLKRFKAIKHIKVHGIEPSIKAAEFSKKINGIDDVKTSMVEELSNSSLKYDVIVMVHTLEHVKDPRAVLSILKNSLNPGGRLFIEVPYYFSYNGLFRFRANERNYPSPNHLFVFSGNTLTKYLKLCGFSIVSCQSGFFRNLNVIVTNKKDKGKINLANKAAVVASLIFFLFSPFVFGSALWARKVRSWVRGQSLKSICTTSFDLFRLPWKR